MKILNLGFSGLQFMQAYHFKIMKFLGWRYRKHKKQIFEHIEQKGFLVGAISPMNASNCLSNPAYFIPDPWTKTPTDGYWLSNNLQISCTISDNSKEN